MAGLTSERMQQLVGEAREAFDWVILDTPPVGLMTDASLLSAMADGTVFVVKAGSTPYHVVERAIERARQNQLLGAVLNRATAASHGTKYYDYYHYAAGQGAESDGVTGLYASADLPCARSPSWCSRPCSILSAVAVAAYARLQEWAWVIVTQENGLTKTLIVAGVTQASLYYADLYDLKRLADRRELFVRVAQALGGAALILAVVYYWFPASSSAAACS